MSHSMDQRLEKRGATKKRVDSVLWRKKYIRCVRVITAGQQTEWRPVDGTDFVFYVDGLATRVQFIYRRVEEL